MRHPSACVLALALLGASPRASVADPTPDAPASTERALIPRTYYFGAREFAHPKVSPDGKSLGYLRGDSRGAPQLWVRTIGTTDDRAMTRVRTGGVGWWCWTWDSRKVLWLQDADGSEHAHLWSSTIDGGEIRDLTPFEGVNAIVHAYPAKNPTRVLLLLDRVAPGLYDGYGLDLETGAIGKGQGQLASAVPLFGGSSQLFALAIPSADGAWRVHAWDAEKQDWATLAELPSPTRPEIVLSADGKTIYYVTAKGSGFYGLVALDLASGTRTVLASDAESDVDRVLWDPVAQRPLAAVVGRDRPRWIPVDPSVDLPAAPAERADHEVWSIASRSLAGDVRVVRIVSDLEPARFVLQRRGATGWSSEPLGDVGRLPAGARLARRRFLEVRTSDGLRLACYLTVPEGGAAKGLPGVLLVHGGPASRDDWGFDTWSAWLADRGYAVLQVNFRGSEGFGEPFERAGDHEMGAKMQEDLLVALDQVVADGTIDPKRVAIMGASYGGYATLRALEQTPDRFVCGVDICGPTDLVEFVGRPAPHLGPGLRDFVRTFGDPAVAAEREMLADRSPLTHVSRLRAPLRIFHGAKDARVNVEQSRRFVAAIPSLDLDVQYEELPDEGHEFRGQHARLDTFAAIETFLSKYLHGRFEPR